mmetsp:Transcript_18653/g.65912  ORF Transcript_18653/g.65912 Transcript_18653/m.65912 type:complete len:217 (+) Transcript_18653:1492-2142(+)
MLTACNTRPRARVARRRFRYRQAGITKNHAMPKTAPSISGASSTSAVFTYTTELVEPARPTTQSTGITLSLRPLLAACAAKRSSTTSGHRNWMLPVNDTSCRCERMIFMRPSTKSGSSLPRRLIVSPDNRLLSCRFIGRLGRRRFPAGVTSCGERRCFLTEVIIFSRSDVLANVCVMTKATTPVSTTKARATMKVDASGHLAQPANDVRCQSSRQR